MLLKRDSYVLTLLLYGLAGAETVIYKVKTLKLIGLSDLLTVMQFGNIPSQF